MDHVAAARLSHLRKRVIEYYVDREAGDGHDGGLNGSPAAMALLGEINDFIRSLGLPSMQLRDCNDINISVLAKLRVAVESRLAASELPIPSLALAMSKDVDYVESEMSKPNGFSYVRRYIFDEEDDQSFGEGDPTLSPPSLKTGELVSNADVALSRVHNDDCVPRNTTEAGPSSGQRPSFIPRLASRGPSNRAHNDKAAASRALSGKLSMAPLSPSPCDNDGIVLHGAGAVTLSPAAPLATSPIRTYEDGFSVASDDGPVDESKSADSMQRFDDHSNFADAVGAPANEPYDDDAAAQHQTDAYQYDTPAQDGLNGQPSRDSVSPGAGEQHVGARTLFQSPEPAQPSHQRQAVASSAAGVAPESALLFTPPPSRSKGPAAQTSIISTGARRRQSTSRRSDVHVCQTPPAGQSADDLVRDASTSLPVTAQYVPKAALRAPASVRLPLEHASAAVAAAQAEKLEAEAALVAAAQARAR